MQYLIHSTVDPETGKPLKDYYSQIPIPEDAEFVVQYGPHTLRFKMIEHWITNERHALVELVDVTKQLAPCGPKRPVLKGNQNES